MNRPHLDLNPIIHLRDHTKLKLNDEQGRPTSSAELLTSESVGMFVCDFYKLPYQIHIPDLLLLSYTSFIEDVFILFHIVRAYAQGRSHCNVFVIFDERIFKQTVGIPMETNSAPGLTRDT